MKRLISWLAGVSTQTPGVPVGLCILALYATPTALAQEDQIGSRGLAADKVYDFSEVDSVGLFNGNLTLTIALGIRYPINSTFSYGDWARERISWVIDGSSDEQ